MIARQSLKIMLMVVLSTLVSLEAGTWALSWLRPTFFRPSEDHLGRNLDFEAYRRFLERDYDAVTGWRNPGNASRRQANCVDEIKDYDYDHRGARRPVAARGTDVIVVGDSFTHGDDAGATETYPYRLGALTGLAVANHGVNGFGPLQATLLLEQVAPTHPDAQVAVLGIMYENILRLANGFRPAYQNRTTFRFGFKPYVDPRGPVPTVRANANAPPATSRDALLGRIVTAFAEDYWGQPPAAAPHLLALARLLPSPRLSLAVRGRLLGHSTLAAYDNPRLVAALELVIARFITGAMAAQMKPIVAFIPRDQHDRQGPGELIARLTERHPEMAIVDVGAATIDWSRYTLPADGCHPSAYGYDQIARSLVPAVSRPPAPPAQPAEP